MGIYLLKMSILKNRKQTKYFLTKAWVRMYSETTEYEFTQK